MIIDTRGTICDSCNYLVDSYELVPWGDDTAKVCAECNMDNMEVM